MSDKTKNIVIYHNDLNYIDLKDFKAIELDIFFNILFKLKNNGVTEIKFDFAEFRNFVNLDGRNNDEIGKILSDIYSHLLRLVVRITDLEKKRYEGFTFFNRYVVDVENKSATISINDGTMYLINDLTKNFTQFELKNFVALDSKYTKNIFKNLKQFDRKGKKCFWDVKLLDFKIFLGIPNSYRMTDINQRILRPALKELSAFFNDLTVEKVKKGRNIDRLIFRWTNFEPIEVIQEPEMAQEKPKPTILEEETRENGILSDLENYIVFECENITYGEEKYLKNVNYIEKTSFLAYCIDNLKYRFNFLNSVKEKMTNDEVEKNQIRSEREEIILKIGKLELEKNVKDYLEQYGKSYLESKYLGKV